MYQYYRILFFLSCLCLMVASYAQTYDLAKADQDMAAVLNELKMPDGEPALWQAAISERRVELGMPVSTLIEMLGRDPDEITEIGAACGMLEIISWGPEQTKIIANRGKVSSIVPVK